MAYIKPTGEQIKRLVSSELDGPVVMLNLLKFDKQAKDGEGSGRDAFQRYGDELASIMEARGITLLWRGRADSVVIGDDDADGWDEVLLVQYPSRKVFLEMAGSKEYEGVGKHRTSALADSRLIACTQRFPASR